MTISFKLNAHDVMMKDVVSITNAYDGAVERHYSYALPADQAVLLREKLDAMGTPSPDGHRDLFLAHSAKLHNAPGAPPALVFLRNNQVIYEGDFCYGAQIKSRSFTETDNGTRQEYRDEYTRSGMHLRTEYDLNNGRERTLSVSQKLDEEHSYRITSLFRENYTLRLQEYETRSKDPAIPRDESFLSQRVDTSEYLYATFLHKGKAFKGISAICGKLSPLEFCLWTECKDAVLAREMALNLKRPRLPKFGGMIETIRNLF